MEEEKKLDSGRVASPECRPQLHGHLRTGDRLSLGTDSKQRLTKMPHRSYRVFCCRRLSSRNVRATIFISTSRASEEILCRADWLCLRCLASCECAILPIREIATYSRCGGSRERPTARCSLQAPEPVNTFCWQPAESQQHNRPDGRDDESDVAAGPFLPLFLLQELIFAHCPHQPRSPIRGNFLFKPDWLQASCATSCRSANC